MPPLNTSLLPRKVFFKKKYTFTRVLLLLLFCLCVWLIIESVSPHLPTAEEPLKLYSNQTQQDLRLTLVEAIRKSKESIHLVMFGLSDPAILSALSRTKAKTVIYYDPNGSPNLYGLLPNCQLHPIRGSGLMHQKILIVDKETIFLGSANMTTASLSMHDNLVIGLKSAQAAQFLIEKTPNSPGYFHTIAEGQPIELWLLPDPKGHTLQDLRRNIKSAKKSIRIALFTFTHPDLIEELLSAHKRGVQVQVVIDLHSGLGASKSAIEKMKKSNIAVSLSQGLQLLHHKFILIDEQTLITGSANWTKAAFYKNSDCIVVLHHLTKTQKNVMNRLWKRLISEASLLTNN